MSLSKLCFKNENGPFGPSLSNWQDLQRKQEIFVITCGICQGVDKKQISKQTTGLTTTQKLHKYKACGSCNVHCTYTKNNICSLIES